MNNHNLNKNDIISAIFKLFEILDAQIKENFLLFFLTALCVSIMEILTAFTAMKFAQILNDASLGIELLKISGSRKI